MNLALVALVVLSQLPSETASAGDPAPPATTEAAPAEAAPAEEPAAEEPNAEASPEKGDDYLQLAVELGLIERVTQTQVSVGAVHGGEDVFRTASNVSVIDRATLETYGFRTVTEAVTTLAGVGVMRTYLKRGLPTIRGMLQDLYADKVLVLVDGVPSWHAITGEGNLDRVDIHDVERIEVLKGPASVVYGTNAYSGAINLVLRRPEAGDKGQVRAEAGSLRHWGAGGQYRHEDDKLKVLVSANANDERGQLKGFTDETGAYGLVPQYMKAANGTLSVRYFGLGGQHSLLFNGYAVHESTLGVTPLYSQGAGKDHYLEGYLAHYSFQHDFGEDGGLRAGVIFDWNHRDLPRTADDSERANIVGYRLESLLSGHYSPTKWLTLEAGGDLDYRYSLAYSNFKTKTGAIVTNNNMSGQNMIEGSVLGQVRLSSLPLWSGMPLEFVGGIRYTNNQFFGDNVSARGTLAWAFSQNASVKIVAAQSFRAPTLFEMNFQTPNLTVHGNKDLKPEKSNSVELVVLGGFSKLFAHAAAYYATYEDKIYRVRYAPESPTDKSLVYVNAKNGFKGWGAEVEVRFEDPDILTAFANYAYEHGSDDDKEPGTDHYNFKYIAEHTASFGLARAIGPVTPSTVLRLVSTQGAPLSTLPLAVTWDASLSLKLGPTTHTLHAENILGTDAMVPEYVRRNLNALPSGVDRRITYLFAWSI